MAILFMCSGDERDLARFNTYTGATVDSSEARTGTYAFKLTSAGALEREFPGFTAMYTKCGMLITTSAGNAQIQFREGTTVHVTVALDTSAGGTLKVYRGTTAGTVLGSYTPTITQNVWYCLEVYASIHDSTGAVTVKLDGATICTLINQDTQNAGTGTCDRIRWLTTVNYGHFDDIVVGEGWAGIGGLYLLLPNAAGSTSGWTASAGNAYACVDEAPPSFTDYIYAAAETPGTVHLLNITSLPITPQSISGVAVLGYARLSAAGSGAARLKIKNGAVTTDGADLTLSTSGQWMDEYYALNPEDSAAWENADIDATEIGIETR